ncbi:MAG TPA: alpha/beta hydrolase [Anaerolineales bacterium]|nr:alpha/beta hydrolase [Anaerolineales bacterium]
MQYDFKNIRVGDRSLAYIEQGHGETVVFVHGSGATDLRTWGQQIEPFAERYHVIAYSQRYHYPNPWAGDGSDINSTTVHASDLAALITALRPGRVHLIGVSYGADIVLRAAVEHPELIRTLVITEPALFSWLIALPRGKELLDDYGSKISPAKETVQRGDLELGMRLYIDSFMGSGVFDQLPASTRERILANVRLIGAETADASEIGPDVTREEVSTIQAPTLVLTGSESPEMFLLVSRELARYLPNAEQALINDASHLLHVMNPDAYNSTVLAFLAKYAG